MSLVAHIFVNNLDLVSTVAIVNTLKITKSGRAIYKIIKPEACKSKKVYHRREDGWEILTIKTLQTMIK